MRVEKGLGGESFQVAAFLAMNRVAALAVKNMVAALAAMILTSIFLQARMWINQRLHYRDALLFFPFR